MPPRIEPQPQPQYQPFPPMEPTARPRAGAAPQRTPQIPPAPAAARAPVRVAETRGVGTTPAVPADATTARAGGLVVEPIQQSMPERIVEMFNAQRGREAATAIGRAARPAADVATAQPSQAAETPAATGPAETSPADGAGVSGVIEPAGQMVRFAPEPAATRGVGTTSTAPADTGTARMAGFANDQVRQAAARQAFQAVVAANAAPQAMGGPTRPGTIIDQRV